MKTMGAAKFREQCLALLDRLDSDGLVITKRGKPVARVVPYVPEEAVLVGCLQHKTEVKGDIFTTGVRWDAERQEK